MGVDLDTEIYEPFLAYGGFVDNEAEVSYDEAIFIQNYSPRCLSKEISVNKENSLCEQKTISVFNRSYEAKTHEASATASGTVNWGGKNGLTYSGSIQAQARDKKGNGAQVSVTQNSDGTGSATISGTKKTPGSE